VDKIVDDAMKEARASNIKMMKAHQASSTTKINAAAAAGVDIADLVEKMEGLTNAMQHNANALTQQSNRFNETIRIVSENQKEGLRIVSDNNKEALQEGLRIVSENNKEGMLALADALKSTKGNDSTPPSTPRHKAPSSARRARKAVMSAEKSNIPATSRKPRVSKVVENKWTVKPPIGKTVTYKGMVVTCSDHKAKKVEITFPNGETKDVFFSSLGFYEAE
jgi:hypothetical protein